MPLDPVALKSLALELSAALPPVAPVDPNARPVDISPRGKAMRAILRIADQHGWHSAVSDYLEEHDTVYLSDLSNHQLDDLLSRMRGFVDMAEVGASLPDFIPAG